MASAYLKQELECSVCLSLYRDPVMLTCGHNFCRHCIDRVLETQEGSGGYSCPECREEFVERPALSRNIKVRNMVENFHSTSQDKEEMTIFCTYCVDSPVPAVKSCLHCEASLCTKHLNFHSKSPEHVIINPIASLKSRKCLIHRELLKYFCPQDAMCICVSCCLIGDHKGHTMESLDEASDKRKQKLKETLQTMASNKGKTEKQVTGLQEEKKKVEHKASEDEKAIKAVFKELRKQLQDLEKRILGKISRQLKQASHSLTELIDQLEIKKDEMYRKMRHIEELCNTTDPLTVLQEPDIGDTEDTTEQENGDQEAQRKPLQEEDHLDISGLSGHLHTLSDMMTRVNIGIYVEKSTDLLLDVETANNNLHVSSDRRTGTWSSTSLNRPEKPERFQDYAQALSTRVFSSGKRYWDIDLSGTCNWRVGVCYPSIDRKGKPQSRIGNNNMSWGLYRCHNQYGLIHDSKDVPIPANISSCGVRIYLDYDAGRLSFYELGIPGRHLHTFTATFTERLHATLGVWGGCAKISV